MSNAPDLPASSSAPLHEPAYVQPPLPPHAYDVQLGVGETLAATFRMWAQSLPKLSLLGFLPNAASIPMAVITTLTFVDVDILSKLYSAGGGIGSTVFTALTLVGGLLSMAGVVAAAGATVHVVDEKERGSSIGPFQALFGLTRWGGWLFLAWLLVGCIWAVGFLAVAGPIFASFAFSHDVEWEIGLLAIPGLGVMGACFWLMARLTPVMPIIVVEERDLGAAINRSWAMTRGNTGTIVGAALLFGFVYLVLSSVTRIAVIIPAFGAWANIAIASVTLPLAMVFPFAVYAGLVNREAQVR